MEIKKISNEAFEFNRKSHAGRGREMSLETRTIRDLEIGECVAFTYENLDDYKKGSARISKESFKNSGNGNWKIEYFRNIKSLTVWVRKNTKEDNKNGLGL